jgi:hypothetical protein
MAAWVEVGGRMGFDPRHWRPSATAPPVTANVEELLAENESLRREVRALRQQLDQHAWSPQRGRSRVTSAASHGITAARLERWGAAMALHPRWQELRLGPPAGLRGLVEELRSQWWNPRLDLEQELNRRCPGLGSELVEALRGPHCRWRWAVRAAFALYGPRASEWLEEAPMRVVEELLQRSQGIPERPAPAADPRQEALALLGLEPGASPAEIRRAYRRLAKNHHPDLGGDVTAFLRLDAAYRLLVG